MPLVWLEPQARLEILGLKDSLETPETWDPAANQEHQVAQAHLEHVEKPVVQDHLASQVLLDHLVQVGHVEIQVPLVPQAFKEIQELLETQVSL